MSGPSVRTNMKSNINRSMDFMCFVYLHWVFTRSRGSPKYGTRIQNTLVFLKNTISHSRPSIITANVFYVSQTLAAEASAVHILVPLQSPNFSCIATCRDTQSRMSYFAMSSQWKWAQKVANMHDSRWTTEVLSWYTTAGRKQGRPEKRWADDLNTLITNETGTATSGEGRLAWATKSVRWVSWENAFIFQQQV